MISRHTSLPYRVIGMRIALVLVGGLASVVSSAENTPRPACTREEAIKAETEASSLKTWNDVYDSYKRYRQCDDGAISEGYSNSVATLLADHWDQVDSLTALVRKDSKFKAFVLRHVDALMTSIQAKEIKENVQSRCPPKAHSLCQAIGQTALSPVPGHAPGFTRGLSCCRFLPPRENRACRGPRPLALGVPPGYSSITIHAYPRGL